MAGQPVGENRRLEQASSAYDLIAVVNQLRKANGLPPYQVNGILMAIAQSHSDYQASIGTVTHSGPGGSRPRDRALAAGYGGGATILISENIMGGRNLSAQGAVQWWQGDAPHLNTMLSPNYQEVGAGVAIADGVAYYTLDVAYVAGASAPPGEATSPPSPGSPLPPSPTFEIVIPVSRATPNPDGSILHVVQTGQTLWNIAAVYEVALPDLLALNGLNDNSVIFPGEKLLIKPPAGTPTPTETVLPTRTPTETPSAAITSTGSPAVTPSPVALSQQPGAELHPNPTQTPLAKQSSALPATPGGIDPLLLAIAVLVVLGLALVLFSGYLKRKGL